MFVVLSCLVSTRISKAKSPALPVAVAIAREADGAWDDADTDEGD